MSTGHLCTSGQSAFTDKSLAWAELAGCMNTACMHFRSETSLLNPILHCWMHLFLGVEALFYEPRKVLKCCRGVFEL